MNVKPVSREWLYEKYVTEQMGTVQIARLVKRHPKRVYEWLLDFGIPTREKWHGNIPPAKPFHDPEWLRQQYESGKSIQGIAAENRVAPGTIYKYMVRFGIERRTGEETLRMAGKKRGVSGPANPMYGRRGAANPNWKGGCTPER